MTVGTYLDRILEAHRAAARRDTRDAGVLATAAERAPAPRPFASALAEAPGLAVIAEIKRRSPSLGTIVEGADPGLIASAYAEGGATCLSVLTDVEFFGGSADDLCVARRACSLPVLRKDFTVCAADVYDARAMGADAVLLIAAALDPDELVSLHALTVSLDMDALVEVHDPAELARALGIGATLIGVNQRDLVTFKVDTERAERMAALIPPGVVSVAESGIDGPSAAARLAAAGYTAILVGETLMRAADRAAAVSSLVGAR